MFTSAPKADVLKNLRKARLHLLFHIIRCVIVCLFLVQRGQHQQRRGGDEDDGEQRQREQHPRQNGHRRLHLHRAEQLGHQVQTLWAEVSHGPGAEGSTSVCVCVCVCVWLCCYFGINKLYANICQCDIFLDVCMAIRGWNCELLGGNARYFSHYTASVMIVPSVAHSRLPLLSGYLICCEPKQRFQLCNSNSSALTAANKQMGKTAEDVCALSVCFVSGLPGRAGPSPRSPAVRGCIS